jgi:hypothetical protein
VIGSQGQVDTLAEFGDASFLTAACWLLNRAIGVPAPLWASPA